MLTNDPLGIETQNADPLGIEKPNVPFLNRTGLPEAQPLPKSPGDYLAQNPQLQGKMPLGEPNTVAQVMQAPVVLGGRVVAGALNAMAGKDQPDQRRGESYDPTKRSGLQQMLFGPSNRSVFGRAPDAQMFHQGVPMLNPVKDPSDLRKIVEGFTTPEGAAAPLTGAAGAAAFGAATLAQLPQMRKDELMQNAAIIGASLLTHKAFGGHAPAEITPLIDVRDLQRTMMQNEIKPSVVVKDGLEGLKQLPPSPAVEGVVQPDVAKPTRDIIQNKLPETVQYPLSHEDGGWVDRLGRKVDANHQLIPEGDNNVQIQGVQNDTAGVATRGIQPSGGSATREGDVRVPEVGKEAETKVDDLSRYNQLVQTMKTAPTVEAWQELEALKNRHGGKPPGRQGEEGSVGLHLLDPQVWKDLGFRMATKVSPEQLLNRLRNKLGEGSAQWDAVNTPEFKAWLQTGLKRTEEVQKWVDTNGPKVEVRKFGEGSAQTPQQKRFRELEHEFDSLPRPTKRLVDAYLMHNEPLYLQSIPKELHAKLEEYSSLNKKELHEGVSDSHWQFIAPKSEKDMPGYVEIAVVKPHGTRTSTYDKSLQAPDIQFPSSHNFPPNTLGFVRGYMETLPNGKKVFHVIEVQSDWAQRQREWKEAQKDNKSLLQGSNEPSSDPLLPHYERLALKAAIDHARSEGADAIAISDAETAMMTEGHDRAAHKWVEPRHINVEKAKQFLSSRKDLPEYTLNLLRKLVGGESIKVGHIREPHAMDKDFQITVKPDQAGGMRLHYDKTLPKIAEELTGQKGERVSMGEHKMAYLRDYQNEQNPNVKKEALRKDLIFKNPDGTPKTDVSGRMYPIGKSREDFSTLGKDKPLPKVGNEGMTSESGSVLNPVEATKQLWQEARDKAENIQDAVKDFLSNENVRSMVMRQSGVSAPKTTAADKATGNQLVMYAQSEGVANAVARSLVTDVLGARWKDPKFDERVGAVAVEDNLRGLKDSLTKQGNVADAAKVKSIIGQPWSPFQTEAAYQQAKNSPEVSDALSRHYFTVQQRAEQMHTELGGKLRKGGLETDAFVNLIAQDMPTLVGKSRQGDLTATMKKGTRFGKQFKGTADAYNLSYRAMAERMVKGNWSEIEKRKLFDAARKSGIAVLQKAGQNMPVFGDEKYVPIPVQRRTLVIEQPGTDPVSKSQNETLWVKERYAEEFRQAFGTDSKVAQHWLAKGITGAQTSLGADAAFHIGNMAAAIVTVPEKATAIKLMLKNIGRVLEDSPEVQRELAKMAEEAGIVRFSEHGERGLWEKLIKPGSKAIQFFDKVGRLTLDELYRDAVKRGESPNDPVWRRAFTQGKLGEYNKRLLTRRQQVLKEIGASPFLVAGKTFNRLALNQVALSPGRKAASVAGGARMRIRQAAYTAGLVLAAPMVINTMMTGNPFPPGVDAGQIVVKKNDDGSYGTVDIAQLLMLRRGLRNTGLQAVTRGIENKQSVSQIATQVGTDIVRGVTHPYAGPAIGTAEMATMGREFPGYGRAKDESTKSRLEAAAKSLNPTTEALLGSTDATKGDGFAKKFGRVVGYHTTQTGYQRMAQLARQYNERAGKPEGAYPASQYVTLREALRKNDAQAARRAMTDLLSKGVKKENIGQYFDNFDNHRFTGSKEDEPKFVAGLSAEDKKLYETIQQQNAKIRENFYNIFEGKSAPRRPREGRQPTKSKSRFSFLSRSNSEQDNQEEQ